MSEPADLSEYRRQKARERLAKAREVLKTVRNPSCELSPWQIAALELVGRAK
jgi:hypothetical protein